MDPDEDTTDDDGPDLPDRPLPPPPTIGDLFEVARRRVALGHPGIDPVRVLLAVAAVVGMGGMAWALWFHRAPAGTPTTPVALVTTTPEATTTHAPPTTGPTEFIVDVVGAVREPGPVRVEATGRVEDAIRAAGGVRADADLERVDRAALLADGQRIYVPTKGQTDIPQVVGPTGGGRAPGPNADAEESPPVDVNTAGEAELITLPGVGPATAQAIIDHREANGPFASVDDLLAVKGIGPAKLETLRPHVTV